MIPVVSSQRIQQSGGSWTSKLGGDLVEGDPTITRFGFTGRIEVRELGGHLRLFFENVLITKRPFKANDAFRKKLFEQVKAIRLQKKAENTQNNEEDDSESDDEEQQEEDAKEVEKLIEIEKNKPLVIPKLNVYLTTKKPKMRMVDAHKSGSKIIISNVIDGQFGKENETCNYEASLLGIPDPLSYVGLVVLKLPQNEPVTDEPIIHGLAKLVSYGTMRMKTNDALHLTEISETIARLVLDKSLEKSAELQSPKKATDNVKPLSVYRNLASKCWVSFEKEESDDIDFDLFLKMLDYLNVFLVTTQALRIFKAVDLRKKGEIGILEFENFLVALDILGPPSNDLVLLDIFDSLKGYPLDDLLKEDEDAEAQLNNSITAEKAKKKKLAEAVAAQAKIKRPIHDPDEAKAGLDYSGFCEAIQIMGVKGLENPIILEAFCFGAGIKEKDADRHYMNITQFRKGFLRVAYVEEEFNKRSMKYEQGVFAQARNRERLARVIADAESAYLTTLSKINDIVERVKQERRQKKDEKRREQAAYREKLEHEAAKFIAIRAQEKRLLLKKEQEERSKKRLEDKILRNKLLLRQQENQQMKRAEIREANLKNERLRMQEIKLLGYDVLDLSVQEMRFIPPKLYDNQEAQLKLSYVVNADFSHNLLDYLPPENFLYWMAETRRLKLSQNRLKTMPADFSHMVSLEILELDTNKLESIPDGFVRLSALQRLDLSNNLLQELPPSLGECSMLKYLNVHSNYLTHIPSNIGQCYRLEYIDLSRNQISELPLDFEYLASLTHLDLRSNQIGVLPPRLGECKRLRYLDVSTNLLATLPESFSMLESLEFCNLENNCIAFASDCYNNLTELKILNIRKNNGDVLHKDVGSMISLTLMDASVNTIQVLPPEIGLLTALQ
eukprot:gene9130-12314_t